MADLLDRLEHYFDALPRRLGGRAEVLGQLTLFVKEGPGWPLYARQSVGAADITSADIAQVERRMRELAVPQNFEWVLQTTPSMRASAVAAGYQVTDHPLLATGEVNDVPSAPVPPGAVVRRAQPDDDLATMLAAAELSFATPGTAVADVGTAQLADVVRHPEPVLEVERSRLAAESSIRYAAWVDGVPVCTGLYTPVTGLAEIVGVGTLPAFRRRGLGRAVTAALLADAVARGVEVVFLSAGDEDVARVYRTLGFADVATACIAEPAGEDVIPAE